MADHHNPASGSLGLDKLHSGNGSSNGGNSHGVSSTGLAALSHEQRLKAAHDNEDPASVNSQSTNATGGEKASTGTADAEDQEVVSRVSLLFKFVFIMECFVNFDSGALPATLPKIDAELHLSYTQLGALGGLSYLGLTLASLWGGQWLQKYDQKRILAFSMIANGGCCFLFGIAPWPSVLLLARTATGFTQAFFVIYAPVWVDEFAPSSRQTLWMSLLQVSNPLGIMLGYGAGIITSNFATGDIIAGWGSWRAVFIIQAIILIPFSACIFLVPDRYLKTAEQLAEKGLEPVHGRKAVTTATGLLEDNTAAVAAGLGLNEAGGGALPLRPRGAGGSGSSTVTHATAGSSAAQGGRSILRSSHASALPAPAGASTSHLKIRAGTGLDALGSLPVTAATDVAPPGSETPHPHGSAAAAPTEAAVPAQAPAAMAGATPRPGSNPFGAPLSVVIPQSGRGSGNSPPMTTTSITSDGNGNGNGAGMRGVNVPAVAPAAGAPDATAITITTGSGSGSRSGSVRPSPRASPRLSSVQFGRTVGSRNNSPRGSGGGLAASNRAEVPSFYMTPSARLTRAFSFSSGGPRAHATDIKAIANTPLTQSAAAAHAESLAGGLGGSGGALGGGSSGSDLRPPHLTRLETGKQSTRDMTVQQLVKLCWSKKVYVWTVFTLSTLYFVVTGIQYWITQYCVEYLDTSIGTVGLAFVLVSATGPVAGVMAGGWYVDKKGGYQGKAQSLVAIRIDLIAVAIAIVCALIVSAIPSFAVLMVFTWILLFFGGAVIPSLVGIMMAAVPQDMREFSSALSQIMYNVFGYFLSPVLSGAIMSASGSIAWGFRLVLWWGLFSLAGMFMLWNAAKQRLMASHARRNFGKLRMAAVPEDAKLPPVTGSGAGRSRVNSVEFATAGVSGADNGDAYDFGPVVDAAAVAAQTQLTLTDGVPDPMYSAVTPSVVGGNVGVIQQSPFLPTDSDSAAVANPSAVRITVVAQAGASPDPLEMR